MLPLILTRDPDTRRLAARILLAQSASTIGLAALFGLVWGLRHGASALVGGGIGLAANLFMTLMALRTVRSAGGALGRLLVGQFAKVGLTVALFVVVARTGKVAWPPFLVAYVATLVAFAVVPLMSGQGRDIK